MTDRIRFDDLTSDQYDQLCDERDRLDTQVDQLIVRLGKYADRGIANGQRAEIAEAELRTLRSGLRANGADPTQIQNLWAQISLRNRQWRDEKQRAEQAEELLRVAHDTSNRSEAERARAVERAERAEAAIARVRAADFVARHWHQAAIDRSNIPQAHAIACIRAALKGETRPAQLGLDDGVHDAFRAALDAPPGGGHGGYAQPDPPIGCALPAPARPGCAAGPPKETNVTDQPRKRITIDAPDESTILAARYLDATEGPVQIGATVDTSTRSAITHVLDYIAKAHNSPIASTDGQAEAAPADGARRQRYAQAIVAGGGCVDLAAATRAVLRVADEEQQQIRAELLALQAVADADSKQLAEVDERCDRYATQLAALKRAHVALAEQAGRDQLAQTLREVLGHFVHKGHPGEPCLQTGWISVKTVDRWRTAVRQPLDQPTKETP